MTHNTDRTREPLVRFAAILLVCRRVLASAQDWTLPHPVGTQVPCVRLHGARDGRLGRLRVPVLAFMAVTEDALFDTLQMVLRDEPPHNENEESGK